ncbi:sensor histidine kinase [Pseudoalteromonas ruthenica]|uniref:sensor histidine kinase n=1 Tax=Pseudoalteromonas ruthenica TaxID=151081 RepID=UPI001247B5AA|nr:HAMP domain-containing sensor histidine kinase [Pseudoalteromonas ruthenica]
MKLQRFATWLLGSAVLIIGSLIAATTYVYFSLHTLTDVQRQVQQYQYSVDRLVILKNELLLNRDEASVQALHRQIDSHIAAQLSNPFNAQTHAQSALITETQQALEEYIAHLNTLVSLLTRMGLNEDKGLRQHFRAQAHKLQELAEEQNNLILNNEVLELRRREKDYLMRFDDQNLAQHRQHYDAILTLIERQQLGNSASRILKSYGQNFAEVVALFNRIGVHGDEGIRQTLRQQESRIEDLLQRLDIQYTQTQIDDALLAITATLVVVVLVAVVLLAFLQLLSMRVNDSLTRLHRQIRQVMDEEDFSSRTGLDGRDEIGRLGQDIDQLFAFIEELLERLANAQNKLVEEAKLASLGSMVSGFAHELNTPIGVAITSQSLLKDQFSLLKTDFSTGKLKKHTLSALIDNAEQSLALLENNLNRSASLIDTFKMMAAQNQYDKEGLFNVRTTVSHIMTSLQSEFDSAVAIYHIDIDEQLEIISSPAALTHIITCCVRNCLMHGKTSGRTLEVGIRVKVQNSALHVFIEDNGPGIEESLLSKAFEPFITTKRHEGSTGLGLAIVYNLVRSNLDGQITLHNLPQRGLSVHVTFTPKSIQRG